MSIFRNAQQKIAHTSTVPSLGNKEFRNLQDVISTEKDFIKTNAKSASDWKKSADSLKTWGEAEGEDLNDILSKLSLLFSHYETSQTRFNNHLSTIRLHFKSLRTREESLSDLKSRKRSLGSKIESVEKKLAKMGPENKELMKTTSLLKEYRSEMEGMVIEVRNEEAALGDFKRRTTKDAMGLKCGGLLEMAEKMTIIAEIGKLMVEEIPLDITEPGMPRRQYEGFSKTEQLLGEATRCIANVGFAPTSSGGVGNSFGVPGGHRRNETSLNGTAEDGADPHRADQYGDGQYTNHPEVPEGGFQSTPIYANNQSTFRTGQWAESQNSQGNLYDREVGENETHTGSRLSTEGFRDTAADEWGRSAGAAIAGAASAGGATAIASGDQNDEAEREAQAAREAYRRNTDDNLEDEYSRTTSNVGAENGVNGTEAAASTNLHSINNAATYGTTPKSRENSNEVAPVLPPISTSTPLPGASTAGASTPVSPSDPNQDDATYFASIGSTRAAQAAVRRPNSPPSNPTRYSGVPVVAVSQPALALASASAQKVYEPNPEGRKMTAAAFRKGFNRVPSAQNVDPSGSVNSFGNAMSRQGTSNSTGVGEDVSSNVGDESNASSSIPPLAIKKRNSYQPVHENPDGIDDAAPPYAPGGPAHGSQGPAPNVPLNNNSNINNEQGVSNLSTDSGGDPRASVYGGMDDYASSNATGSRRQSYQSAPPQNQYSYNDPYSSGGGYANPQPPVQPWTSGPNSRPGSAQGSRPLPPNSSSNSYYPSYPTSGF